MDYHTIKKDLGLFGLRAFRILIMSDAPERNIKLLLRRFDVATNEIDADKYEAKRATPVDVEIDNEMAEVEDEIWMQSLSPKRAMPVDVEIDNEMAAVEDEIWMQSLSPKRATPVDVEIDNEMTEILEAIEEQKRRANLFRS